MAALERFIHDTDDGLPVPSASCAKSRSASEGQVTEFGPKRGTIWRSDYALPTRRRSKRSFSHRITTLPAIPIMAATLFLKTSKLS